MIMSDFYNTINGFLNNNTDIPEDTHIEHVTLDPTVTETENGAKAYTPDALSKRTKWYRIISKVANAHKSAVNTVALEAATALRKVVQEGTPDDIADIVVLLTHLRDIREGMGERTGFVELMINLWEPKFYRYHSVFQALISRCGHDYFRFDDFINIVYGLILKADPKFEEKFRFKASEDMNATFSIHQLKWKGDKNQAPEYPLALIDATALLVPVRALQMMLRNVLENDIKSLQKGGSISLLGKWLPSINTSSDETRRKANFVAQGLLNLDNVTYRKLCSRLRKALDIVEHHVTQNTFNEIDYAKVPSLAQNRYRTLFLTKDSERYQKYIADVTTGKAKMNAGAIGAADLIHKAHELMVTAWSDAGYVDDTEQERAALDAQWDNLPKIPAEALVCMDGSGSMYSGDNVKYEPIEIAKALTIYMSENNENFKDQFITFGQNTQVVTLHSKKFTDKVVELSAYNDCGNTDFIGMFETLLTHAKMYHLTPAQMPKTLIVVSDMQFDCQMNVRDVEDINEDLIDEGRGEVKTPYQFIQQEYQRAGYTAPQVVFWCVTAHDALPICREDVGATLCFGCNQNTLRYILENGGTYTDSDIVNNILTSKRYKDIKEYARQTACYEGYLD